MQIDKKLIFEIHRLNHMGWSNRKIARHLCISRPSVKKYLNNPDITPIRRVGRPSKLDPFKDLIKTFLAEDPEVKAPVVYRRIQEKGFDGEITITQSDDPLDCKKSIHVKKLRNKNYIKNSICLT